MEAFHLKCQSPVELLSCRRTSAIQKSDTPTHCQNKIKLATQRLCHKNLITTTTKTLTLTTKPTTTRKETLALTSALITATTTTTATTTVRTLTTITNTSSTSTSSSSLSGNNIHIPIRLRRRLPPPLTSTYEQKKKQGQRECELESEQQQQPHLIHKHRNLWSCLYWRHNLTCIMMTMLFLISIVLSGNTALAAQRESFKTKDANNLNNNGNAIYNEINSGSSSGSSSNNIVGGTSISINGNGNGNAISHGNNNNINNGNTNVTTTTSLSTSTSTSISSSSAVVSGSGYATTTSSHTTSSTSSSSGSGSAGSSSSSSNSHKTSSSSRNSIELQETTQNGPYFDKAASKNVTALLGKTAYLNCRVKNLGNKTMLLQVSWVRHRDIHLLTVGRYTYTSDQRFRAIHQPQTEDWILQIKYPQHRDSGIYECQVSTTPHMSHYIHLNVVEPSTEIIGAPDLYIESGSTINLTCVILNSPEPPAYIFWNHNNAIINYDSPRGGVSVVTNKGETTTSFLLIKSARPSDSGHYQCNPSNAKPKSVTVHVLNGVSHSVSRGIPSSNAARGTSSSSNVSKSLYLSVPVNVLVYLSICQALHKATGYSDWSKICAHVIESCLQLLGCMLLALMAGLIKVLRRHNHNKIKCNNKTTVATITSNDDNSRFITNTVCCYEMQLRENYHMTCTATTIASSNNYSLICNNKPPTTIVKCTCKYQTLSRMAVTRTTTAVFFIVSQILNFFSVVVNFCCYLLLYSKNYNNLFKNARASSTSLLSSSSTTTTTSITVPLTTLSTTTLSLIGNNCSGSSFCLSCCRPPVSITHCLCPQSTATLTATFFSESDIR